MRSHRIHWRDICGTIQWMDLKEAISWGQESFAKHYVTTGKIIFENEDFILVAATTSKEDDGTYSYNDISMIMKSIIIKRVRL